MNQIKQLIEEFKEAPKDTTLARGVELSVKIKYVPNKPLEKYTLLEDESGTLEAVPSKREIFEFLKSKVGSDSIVNIKGRLDKTEYGNIAFCIEEVSE